MSSLSNAIPFRDLLSLDVDSTQSRLVTIQTRLQEAFPTLYLQRGVFHDTCEMIAAILEEQLGENLDDYLSSRSLMDILNDPTLATPDAINAVLSNFLLTPQTGSAAGGSVVIVVNDDTTVTIALGATFQARGLEYTTTGVTSARVEASQVILPTDTLLTPTGDGNWQFTVSVVCETIGSAGMLNADESIIPDVPPNGYVTSYAANDFTGGVDPETTTDLLARQQAGFAPPGLCNQGNFAAVLRTNPSFANVVNQSVVGYGDPQMLRDKHTIFPIGLGGRVDWYVRTTPQYATQVLTESAVLVAKNANVGTWQISIGRDDAPGFYEIESILPPGSSAGGTFPITEIVPGFDFSTDPWHPDIVNPLEAAFTRYQTVLVQFTDTTTDVSALPLGATQNYSVTVRLMPQIDAIQDNVAQETMRSRAGDILVKAPIPCFLTISFTIVKLPGQADPDLTAIANAVALAVNSVGFTGSLFASVITAAAAPLLSTGQQLQNMDMLGRIVRPDGSSVTIRDPQQLLVPETPTLMVGANTVQFFATPDDINITTM